MMLGHLHPRLPTSCLKSRPKSRPMKNDQILGQISEFCRQADMAEIDLRPPRRQ